MRLLIVDDEPALLSSLRVSLEAKCFVVDTASDGARGSFLACTNDYDLVILDNNLPKKSGLEVCAEIRATGKHLPIIILSVENEAPKKVSLLNTGADDYLTKPFSFAELLARINAILRRPPTRVETMLQLDDLTMDSKKQLVKRGAQEIYLTKKEFMLLEYLLKNQDDVVSRGALIEHVWDMNGDLFSNTIETHIRTLRKKIDRPGKKKLIHTVPGRGYKAAIRS